MPTPTREQNLNKLTQFLKREHSALLTRSNFDKIIAVGSPLVLHNMLYRFNSELNNYQQAKLTQELFDSCVKLEKVLTSHDQDLEGMHFDREFMQNETKERNARNHSISNAFSLLSCTTPPLLTKANLKLMRNCSNPLVFINLLAIFQQSLPSTKMTPALYSSCLQFTDTITPVQSVQFIADCFKKLETAGLLNETTLRIISETKVPKMFTQYLNKLPEVSLPNSLEALQTEANAFDKAVSAISETASNPKKIIRRAKADNIPRSLTAFENIVYHNRTDEAAAKRLVEAHSVGKYIGSFFACTSAEATKVKTSEPPKEPHPNPKK